MNIENARLFRYMVMVLPVVFLALAACGGESRPTGDDDAAAETSDPAPTEAPQATPTPEPTVPDPTPTSSAPIPTVESTPDVPAPTPTEPSDSSDPAPESEEEEDWLDDRSTYLHIAHGPNGNYYVLYAQHLAVLVLSPDGELIDAWNDEVEQPQALAVDGAGTVYLVEGRRVKRFEPDGTYLDNLATDQFLRGEFLRAYDIAIYPDDHVVLSRPNRDSMSTFGPDGEYLGEVPQGRSAFGGAGSLIDTDEDGRLYLLNWQPSPNNDLVEVRDQDGNVIHEWDFKRPVDDVTGDELFSIGMEVAADGRIVLVYSLNDPDTVPNGPGPPPRARDHLVQVFTPEGDLYAEWLAVEDTELDEPLWRPARFTVDGRGTLLLPDWGPESHRILRFTLDGEFLGEWQHDVPAFLCEQAQAAYYELDCDG